jgi:transposase InsO family protein
MVKPDPPIAQRYQSFGFQVVVRQSLLNARSFGTAPWTFTGDATCHGRLHMNTQLHQVSHFGARLAPLSPVSHPDATANPVIEIAAALVASGNAKEVDPATKVLAVPTIINASWSMDFMHDQLEDGRSYRLFNMIDDYSREGLGIEVDLSLPSERVVRALGQIIDWRGKPSQIRCDNGPKYISATLAAWAEKQGITLAFIQPGNPQQNAYIERYNRTVRYDWLAQYLFDSIEEVQNYATRWLWHYNNQRPNMGIGGITPQQKLAMTA